MSTDASFTGCSFLWVKEQGVTKAPFRRVHFYRLTAILRRYRQVTTIRKSIHNSKVLKFLRNFQVRRADSKARPIRIES